MYLEWLTLSGFRSHTSLEWRPDPGINVLVGDNGAGKTNLLEGVSYLASLRSFRGSPDEALVGHDVDSAVVRGSVVHPETTTLIEIEIRRRGGRRTQVNRQRLQRSADLIGHVRMVAFLPEDLDIVKRGPAHRRDLLDDAGVQLWPSAYAERIEFERALRQRNAFLKQGADDPVTLAVWDERFAQAAGRVLARRLRTLDAVAMHLAAAYREISADDSEVAVRYDSEWMPTAAPDMAVPALAAAMQTALERSRRVDRERRLTTVGPHRDEPSFVLNGRDARHQASQGEQRTIALAVRLAAHRAISDLTDTSPILLLDDVFSELDPGRAKALTGALPQAQTLITTADPAHVPVEGRSWILQDGTVDG